MMSLKFDKSFWGTFLILLAILLLECAIHWTYKTFGRVNFDEISLTMTLGIGGTDISFISDFIKRVVLRATGWATVLAILCRIAPWRRVAQFIAVAIVSCILVMRLCNDRVETGSFFHWQSSDFYETEYVAPKTANITFKNPKNVIVIMLESMEKAYDDENLFGKNGLTPNISKLERDNISFGQHNAISGMTRTISAIIGVTTGLPLFYKNHKNVKKMLGTDGIGTVFANHGYQTWSIFPASGQFSQKADLLRRMGIQNVIDGEELRSRLTHKLAQYPFNGVDDYTMFAMSRPIISDLIKQQKPYFVFMETVNTHTPGFLSPECREMGFNNEKMETITKCDDRIIGDFVNWARKADPTAVIVLISDHPMHVNNSSMMNKLRTVSDRRLSNVFINTNIFKGTDTTRPISAMDYMPTIIEAAGGHIDGCRLGLGTSMSARCADTKTMREKYGDAELETLMQRKNKLYFQLVWGE